MKSMNRPRKDVRNKDSSLVHIISSSNVIENNDDLTSLSKAINTTDSRKSSQKQEKVKTCLI